MVEVLIDVWMATFISLAFGVPVWCFLRGEA
jgi:hypothetical protein